jgi:uncharacterized protein
MPWRNGRGTTLEIARAPRRGAAFNWRLSLATIAEAGEFSAYTGYDRALVLASGAQLRLRFTGHGRRTLTPRTRAVRFSGDWHTCAEVPRGACTDLTLIVRRLARRQRIREPRLIGVKAARNLQIGAGIYAAVFVLAGSVAVRRRASGRAHTLRRGDTLLLEPGAERTLRLRSLAAPDAQLAVLRWMA